MASTDTASHAAESAHPLVNDKLVRAWLRSALVWLTVFPLIGLLVSIKFHNPDFLGDVSWLTYGRLRPVHVNGVIFGAFSTPFLALVYYIVPHLCGRRMAAERLGWVALYGWDLFLVTGSISLLMGYNLGFEADEFQLPIDALRWGVLLLIGVQALVTIFRRKNFGLYVALWYTIAAFTWTLLNLALGNLLLPYSPMSGVNNAALHGLYIHYVVGLWITPAGLAVMYYFIPVALKNPLFSHKLSLLGFWSLALLYPFLGTHHYIFSPIPYMTQTVSIVCSMLLIVPVWAVITNHWGTALGRWQAILGNKDADAYAAKFLMLAVFFYLTGCFQGSVEALRRMQELTHFNDFVIAHSHATIFGTFVVAMMGAMYYVWPRVTGNQLWSWRLASWHLWLTIIGFCVMVVGLTAQGFIEGGMFENKVNFVDEVAAMKPWWVVRTFAGASMDIGILLMVINFYKTARQRVPFREAPTRALEAHPAGAETKGVYKWIVNPSALTLGAGVSFFAFGVIIQGIWPSIVKESNEPTVADASTGKLVRVASYTPLELRGREVYIREGCWYCHSQYVRPVTKEYDRWGPVSDAGEYVYDQPHMFGTRRTGPDLWRVGRKYGDGWHAAHHWNPRIIVPDSIMPRFPWLFDPPKNGEAPQLNEEGKALVAYIQRLGTTLGDWRETYSPTRLNGGAALLVSGRENREDLVAQGKQVYIRRCVGCHGEQGDGKGPGAQFFKVKPRDFTTGIFKFRSTSGGINTLPSDEDLFITVTHGLWGTPMPPWYDIPSEERIAVIQYIKTFSDRWKKEPVNPPIKIPTEPQITEATLAHGKQLFAENCAVCHGIKGRGQGPAADHIHDVWGHPLRPANFTLPAGVGGGVKLGHDALHIYKTIMTGVGGTPMPPFALSKLTPEEVWDIVHYVQSLRIDAHMGELIAAGLRDDDRSAARTQLWVNLSDAAARGRIERQVVQVDGVGSTPLVLGQVR